MGVYEVFNQNVLPELFKESLPKNYSKKASQRTIQRKPANEKSRQIKELENKLNTLSALLADHPYNETLNNLESAKAELNNHYSYVTEGIIVRSRVQWYEN